MLPGEKSDRLVFVDLETAGLSVWRPIIQIAAIAVTSSLDEVETFEVKIAFDERRATRRTLRRRRYDRKLWKREARREKDVAVDFSSFLARHAALVVHGPRHRPLIIAQLVAHNAQFDGPFLRAWFTRLGLFFPASYRVSCTMQRAMWLFHEHRTLRPPPDYRLDTLCDYFRVPFRPDDAHDALNDVRATVRLYRAMMNWPPRNREPQTVKPRPMSVPNLPSYAVPLASIVNHAPSSSAGRVFRVPPPAAEACLLRPDSAV